MEEQLAQGVAGPSTHRTAAPTVLTTLQNLILAQQNITQAYLHPYAPSPWKGKSRAQSSTLEQQLGHVRGLRDALEAARPILARKDGGDWGRLSRALREVVNHQTALFPISTSLRPLDLPQVDLPSPASLLPPIDVLKALASSLGIQTYLEDSQFGLLKTSLTLAGNGFVVDIDLETDAAAGEEGDEDDPSAGLAAIDTAQVRQQALEREKVRLSKLVANHVTKEGGTGKSDWIGLVLRESLERYLMIWNMTVEGSVKVGERAMELEKAVRGVKEVLEMVRWLDDVTVASGATDTKGGGESGETAEERDVFAELEVVAKQMEILIKRNETGLYPSSHSTVFPSFRLLPASAGVKGCNPSFIIRPCISGETVPTISSGSDATADQPLPTSWLVEYVSQAGEVDGLVVRRSWLDAGSTRGDDDTSWNGVMKVENILYQAASSSTPQTFPYDHEFVHPAPSGKGAGPEQRWSMGQPGPDLYIVGRVGLPKDKQSLKETLISLRGQVMLNKLWMEIFTLDRLVVSIARDGVHGDEDGNDEDLEALLSAIPISLVPHPSSLNISFPCPYQEGKLSLINLTVSPSPSETSLYALKWSSSGSPLSAQLRQALDGAVAPVEGLPDSLVDLVDRTIQALMAASHA